MGEAVVGEAVVGEAVGLEWKRTLGDPAGWTQSLRTIVGTCTASTTPMHVWWGRERTHIYNDAALALLPDEQHLQPLIDEVFRTGVARWSEPFATVARQRDAEYVACALSPVFGEHGVEGVIGAFMDVPEVSAKRRTRTAFFANVGHEVLSQLSLVLAPIEEVLAGTLPSFVRANLELAHRSSLRLRNIVGVALECAHLEPTSLDFELVDLAELTRDVASNFRSAFEAAGLQLIVDCASGPIAVVRSMWEQIVVSLVANVFERTREGEILVRLRPSEQGARLEVAGVGRSGRRAANHDTLAFARELLAMHGGTIDEHADRARGTTFVVDLPRGPIGTARVRRDRSPDEDAPPCTARVLVVEDNDDVRNYLRRQLARRFTVEVALDGVDALAAMRASPPDILIADVMLPRLDGLSLVREVRRDPMLRHTPIVLVSGRTGEQSRIDGLAAGADDYLTKPFSARELRARVDAHLALARARLAAGAVLDAAQSLRGCEKPELRTVLLAKLVEQAIEATRAVWQPRHQTIMVDVPVAELAVDAYRFGQVLEQLITNASDASASGVPIRITGHGVALTVHGEGVGTGSDFMVSIPLRQNGAVQ